MEMVSKKVVCVTVLCMMIVIAIAPNAEALTCGQVTSGIAPCLNYLRSNGPLGGCCGGVRGLVSQAKTPADRKTACGCLKQAANSISGIDLNKAAGLPGTCGVSIPYKISKSTDCSKVN